MADVNASINIDINASSALAQLRALESQISNFNNSVARSNAAAMQVQRGMVSSLQSQIEATGHFNTSIRTMEGSLSSLGTAFDKGTLSAKQYFRYAASQMPGLAGAFRGLGKEQAEMASLAENRVKQLQTRYISLGKEINGTQRMLAVQPKTLASGYATDIALAEQRQQLFNRALQLGSTGMVNWGKNTQWAGRQLMVGFTVPMTIAAGAAAKFFMDLEKSGVAFRRVYGDMDTTTQEAQKNLQAIEALGNEYTKYGLAVSEVIDIGARAAATGAQNDDLLAATEQTLRLATLGQTDYGTALDATISLQTAFGISSANLATTIDFLNAVENQTVLTLEDVARAVPRVAPVIKGLGGDVQDLAVFMTALREGGVSAEQGANALKSGLASLINPTERASETLKGMGINIKSIVDANRGDLMGTVRAFGEALESVSEFERQQALESTFGKYQYARLGALFKNIARDGSQAARAMELTKMSVEDLASLSEKELSVLSESVTNKFLGAIERLKVAIAPIGEMFLKVVTPVIEVVTTIANKFNELPDTVKAVVAGIVGAIGLIAPVVLMGVGLIANGIGNGVKFLLLLRGGIKGLVAALSGSTSSFQYQSAAALDAAAAMGALDGRSDALTGSLLMQDDAVRALSAAYGGLAGAARSAAASMPVAFPGVGRGGRGVPVVRRAMGGTIPGTGNTDSVPALLTPGEFVVNKQAADRFGPVLQAINNSSVAKFARGGPVGFNVGGTSVNVDVASQQTIVALQKRIDAAVKNGASAVEQLVSALKGFANKTSVKISQIDDVIRTIPEIQNLAKPTSWSAPSAIQGQTSKMTWTTRQSEIDAIQKSVAQDWPEIAADTEKMRNLTNNQTSHIEQINKAGLDVSKDWNNLSNLTPDLGGVNNYLNRVKGMTVGAEHVERVMKETGLDFETVNAEVDKLRSGLHPTTAQAANVTQALAKLDNELSLAAVAAGKTRTSLNTVAKTGYQASAVSAGLSARLRDTGDQGFYSTVSQRAYSASQAMGASVVQGADSGMGNASPFRFAREAMDDYVAGIELGASENSGRATKAGQRLGTAVNTGLDRTLSPSQARGAVMLGGVPGQPQASTQSGIPVAARTPIASVDDNQTRVSSALARQEQEIDGATKQTKTMKDRVRGVSGKLFGVSAAFTGLSIAGSFMEGQIGQVAQSIMPFAFAMDGITGLLPMMMNPVGIAIAAFAAVGGGLWFLNNQMNDVRSRAQDFADSLTTSAAEVNKVAEYFGNESLVQRQQIVDIAKQAGVMPKDIAAGMEFIGSDVGQEMARQFTAALEREGGAQSAINFANRLASMMMQGAIDFGQAKQVAAGLAQQLGQPEISAQIIGHLERIVGPDGKDITKTPLKIAAEITANEQRVVDSLVNPTTDAINKAMQMDGGKFAATALISPLSGIVTQLGIDIPYVTDISKNLMSFISDDFENATASAHTYGKAVGNSLRNAYDNLNSAIIRNEEIIESANKKDRPELKKQALIEEAKLREQIYNIQETAEQNFGKLVQQNAALSKEALDGMQVSLKEMYQDPAMQMIVENIFGRTGGLDQEVRFNILMNLQSGALNPMAVNSLFDLIGDPDQAALALSLSVESRGLDATNEFLLKNLQIGDEEVRKKILLQFVAESTTPGGRDQAAELLGFGPEQEQNLKNSMDRTKNEYESALQEFNQISIDSMGRQTRGGRFRLLNEQDAQAEIARLKQFYDQSNTDLQNFYNERKAIVDASPFANAEGIVGPWLPENLAASSKEIQDYLLVLQELESLNIKPKIDLSETDISAGDLEKTTDVLRQFAELPEEMQKTVNVDALQASANLDTFNVNWNKVSSFQDLQKQISVLDGFSSPMSAFGMSWAQYNSLPNIYKEIVLQYVVATAQVKGFYKGQQGMTGGIGNLSQADRTEEYAGNIPNPVTDTPFVPPQPPSGGTTPAPTPPTGGGSGGGGGGGGGEAAKSGADLIKEMIESLKEQLKFLGDYKKKNGEVVSGWADALRSAGAPEQLIADIISKGAEGIKMAKELLKDKAKKLKEVTDLMLEVTRLTFVESQRAEAASLATQTSAQMALANAGLNPAIVANMDSQQAQAVAAAYRAYQTAQRAADAAEDKSKEKRKKAAKELEKTRKEWEMVTSAVNKNTSAQERNAIAQALLTAQQERQTAQNRVSAALALAGRGLSAEKIGGILEIEGAANQVVAYTDKIKKLNDEKTKLEAKGRKNWSDEEKKRYKQLQRQIKDVTGDYNKLLATLTKITKEQAQGAIANATIGFAGRAISTRRQAAAQNILMGQGYTYDQASGIAGSEEDALAITKAQDAVAQGESRVNRLIKERSKYKVGSEKYKQLSAEIKEARGELKEAKTAQDNLNKSIAQSVVEQQRLDWQSLQEGINSEIAKQANTQKFINLGIKDGLVLNRLNNLTLEQQNYFLSLSAEQQKAFVDSLAASIPLSEKIADAFERISAAQRLQTLRNEEATNKQMGKTLEQYDDQLDLLNDQLDVQNDLLRVQQDKVDVIQEENDDLNRGLELLSRQEEAINEAFDKRIEALDKVEQANARIAQQQQNQLNLSQALAEGDIYAATQAAQQIKQDNATAAIENTREAFENAREEQLKNLVVDVNGQLLTRDQIEKRIEGNNDRIYQIQEDQIEPIQKVITSLNDQIDAVVRLKEKWQDYYKFLEDNAVDPITGLKYKDLNRLKELYDAIFNAQDAAKKDARKALEEAMTGTGLKIDSATFFTKFGINPGAPAATTQPGGATTADVNSAREAAITALPEVVKVKEAAEAIKKAIVETPAEINKLTRSLADNAQPAIDKAKESSQGILTKFKNLGKFLVDELMPNSLTPLKEFIAGDLLTAVNNVFAAFMNINGQITGAIVNAGNLANSLNNLQKEIKINIIVNTTYTSTEQPPPTPPKPPKPPKKYAGGLIRMAVGGMVPGGIPRDSVPILASPGEFVVRNAMVDKYGMSMLDDINQGSYEPSFRVPSNISYGKVNKSVSVSESRNMYNNNYNINVTANTNANADEIASAAVMKIRQMNSMQIRGARG